MLRNETGVPAPVGGVCGNEKLNAPSSTLAVAAV